MGGAATATEDAVAQLRLRLYRPDPPLGAVDAYLDALARLPAAPAPRARSAPRPQRPPLRLAAVLVALAVLVVAGAGIAVAAAASRSAAAVVQRPATSVRGSTVPLPSAVGIPIGVLAGDRAASARFDAAGHRVVVSVNCTGDGTIVLRIADEQPFVLTCGNGGPALAVLPSSGSLGAFRLDLRPDERMPWALAVGALPTG